VSRGRETLEKKKRVYYFSEINATKNTYSVNGVRRRLWGEDREKKR
jgi:hypothetical protein